MEEQSSCVLAARKIAEIACPVELALADDVRLRCGRKGAQTYTKPKDIYYMICDRLNEGARQIRTNAVLQPLGLNQRLHWSDFLFVLIYTKREV